MISGFVESHGALYEVSIAPTADQIRVRVRLNQQSWANTFTATYLDDLTRKTGSHREFPVFVKMLCASISGSKGECSMQILSPSDLEALRGSNQNSRPTRPIGDRRYVLLVYQTAFEKTHYPMSLLPEISLTENTPPVLSNIIPTQIESRLTDRTEIHTIVKQLQEEIRRLKNPEESNFRSKFEEMVLQNAELKNEISTLKKEVETSQTTKHQRQMHKLVDEMEKTMTSEKAKFKKTISSKNQKIQKLEDELEELRTDHRSLQLRVKALNNELQTYKRGRTGRPSARPPSSRMTSRFSSSRETSRERNSRAGSLDRRVERKSRPPVYRSTISSRQSSRSRDPSPCGSLRSVGSCASSVGSNRSAGSNRSRKRFDPTAYVRAKKQKELENTKRKNSRARPPPRPSSGHSRESSYSSRISRTSRTSRVGRTRSSTPDPDLITTNESFAESCQDSLINAGSFNIAEIDARLIALQEYMNDLGAH